jgi:hypothetical protein
MRFRASVVLILLLLLSACAGGPTKQYAYVNPDSESKIGGITLVAIIADVCLIKDVLGDDDYWVVQESRSAEGHMLDAAKTNLTGKGYEVVYAQAPFVGAFKNSEKLFKVGDTSGGEVTEKNPPLFEAESLADNPVFRDALLKVIPKVPASTGRNSNLPGSCCSDPELKEHLSTIAKNTGGDATLFLVGHGAIVSAGKQITQGLATGLLTAVLTLGMVSVSRYDVSFMDSYAVLVDNTTGQVLWSNSMRLKGDGFDQAYYDAEKWPKSILYHMPSKTEGKENNEAKPATKENPSQAKDTAGNPEQVKK